MKDKIIKHQDYPQLKSNYINFLYYLSLIKSVIFVVNFIITSIPLTQEILISLNQLKIIKLFHFRLIPFYLRT